MEGGQHHPRMEGPFYGGGLEQAWAVRQRQRKWLLSQVWGWPGWPLGVEPLGTGGSLTCSSAGSPQNPLNEWRVQQTDRNLDRKRQEGRVHQELVAQVMVRRCGTDWGRRHFMGQSPSTDGAWSPDSLCCGPGRH